jgi:CubicO group peptidase (beta-lactamase class C family)
LKQVDEYIQRILKRTGAPGASLAVVHNGRLVKAAGYGWANREKEIPATAHTVYSLASIGKQFTAAAVLLLKQDGLIQMDEPIGKYLRKTPPAWEEITVHHLLSRTSGIRDYFDEGNRLAFTRDYLPTALVKTFGRRRLLFRPGTDWDYSNTNYALLGIIIEKVSGKKWSDLLQARVFDPLAMTSTVIQDRIGDLPEAIVAQGYARRRNKLVRDSARLSKTFLQTADGSVMSSVLDMVKWDRALDTGRILAAASREEMWRPVWPDADGMGHDYAYGWIVKHSGGQRCVWHDGSWAGFASSLCRFVDSRLTVILLANAEEGWGDGERAELKATRTIAAMYDPLVKRL